MFRPDQFIPYTQREASRLSLLFIAGVLGASACTCVQAASAAQAQGMSTFVAHAAAASATLCNKRKGPASEAGPAAENEEAGETNETPPR